MYNWAACLCALAACSEAQVSDNRATSLPLGAAVPGQHAAGSGASIRAATSAGRGGGLADSAPVLTWLQTEHVGPFTSRSGHNAYDPQLNLSGTDLGVSFQRDDKLYFLFGDAWTQPWFINPNQDLDPVGWTNAARPDGVPDLNWVRRDNGQFLAFDLDRHGYKPMGVMNVPVEGIAIGDRNYIFFYNTAGKTAEDQPPVRSILAHGVDDDFANLELDHEVASTKFQSVSVVRDDDDMIWIYGAGPYRNSPVHLARAPVSTFPDRNSWQYYAGPDVYVDNEDAAQALFDGTDETHQNCVGELSVRKYEPKSLYFMAYNCGPKSAEGLDQMPHYVQLRTARSPEGPWSKAETILSAADGYGRFIHADGLPNDGLGEADLVDLTPQGFVQRKNGDIYGPYLIPAWFSEPEPGQYEIFYTISSWNPYQVHLMKTLLVETASAASP